MLFRIADKTGCLVNIPKLVRASTECWLVIEIRATERHINPLHGFMGDEKRLSYIFFLSLAQNANGFFGPLNNRPKIRSNTAFRKP